MTGWLDKRVIVIGAARQGVAVGRYLALHGARVVMNDHKSDDQLKPVRQSLDESLGDQSSQVEWSFGGHPLSLLDGADVVCVSGGVPLSLPLVEEAQKRGIQLTNDSQIFLEACPCRTIGITGSAGKTTTTSLVGKIAEAAVSTSGGNTPYQKIWVGGNIGSPLLGAVEEMQPNDLVVLELSSFQLELMTTSVNIACILNITPNHLDRHATMEAYTAAKARILEYQDATDMAVLGYDDPGAWALLGRVRGTKVSFGSHKPITIGQGAFIDGDWVCLWTGQVVIRVLRQVEIPLRGWHNVENVLAALAVSQAAGLPVEAMREAVTAFTGVPHRLEWVASWKGADWYNDSIATAPERVMAAIHSFESPADVNRPIVLLAGGRDKKLPWYELAKLIHDRVDHLIVFGEAADIISAAVGPARNGYRPFSMDKCTGLQQAVDIAAQVVETDDIVLLSPGGTSFDEFRDFEERGEAFKRWVLNLSCK
ncbi:MAG: UDP-N-acetylmuramoyl-L-alanine--D-glutamate ligase [Anaerolineales bacterium]|nr:MAG: UDP-N-acetylmuramoyl-L-alanine--D-glutamate ligase [Anaerolineales bacterium]